MTDFISGPVIVLIPTVSQLQQTLASVQELLIQQQQKIQELSQELSTAEVHNQHKQILHRNKRGCNIHTVHVNGNAQKPAGKVFFLIFEGK